MRAVPAVTPPLLEAATARSSRPDDPAAIPDDHERPEPADEDFVGGYDLIAEAFFYSRKHLTMFLTRRLAAMEGIVETQTSVVLQVAKLSYEWEIPTPQPE